MSMTVEERKATNKALIDEVLKAYPEKMAKRRAKHLGQYDEVLRHALRRAEQHDVEVSGNGSGDTGRIGLSARRNCSPLIHAGLVRGTGVLDRLIKICRGADGTKH
eukprot:gene11227-15102_t